MNINAKISVCNPLSSLKKDEPITPAATITIGEFMAAVMTDKDIGEQIEAIRAEPCEVKRKQLKKDLPMVTPSGVFLPTVKNENIEKHSGFICVDLDAKDNPSVKDWASLRDIVGRFKQVAFSALSASGNGLFCLVPIHDPSKHLQHYNSVVMDFRKIRLFPDEKCSNVARLRFMSFDEEAVFNPNARTYKRFYTPPPPPKTKYIAPNGDDLQKLIAVVSRKGVDITADYKSWYEVGAALANEYGEAGRTAFHAISQHYSKYNPSEADKQYTKCLGNPKNYRAGTIFHLARLAGITIN